MEQHTIKVKIVKQANGKSKAGYKELMVNGEWSSHWSHMTVTDAKAALKTGSAHVGIVPNCKVVAA